MLCKKRNLGSVVVAACSVEGILLHGDDAKQSSSEPPGNIVTSSNDDSRNVHDATSVENDDNNFSSEIVQDSKNIDNTNVFSFREKDSSLPKEETCPSEIGSESSVPPIAAITTPLPSGRIWGVRGSDASHFTGNTGLQMLDMDRLDLDDIDGTAGYEGDSLPVAAEVDDLKAVQRLLNALSTDINMADENGQTALHIASCNGSVSIVEQLLSDEKIDIHQEDSRGYDALRLACQARQPEIVKRFLKHSQMTAEKINQRFTTVCKAGDVRSVDCFLEHPEVDVNYATFHHGSTPLILASLGGHFEIVKKLLEQSAIEVNQADTDNSTPLLMAAHTGHLEIVQKLLEHPAIEENKANNNNATPLYMASQNGHLQIVQKLLELPTIEVNKVRDDGVTPLFIASQEGHSEIVQALLEHPDIDFESSGKQAIDSATGQGHDGIAKLLRHHSSNESTGNHSESPTKSPTKPRSQRDKKCTIS